MTAPTAAARVTDLTTRGRSLPVDRGPLEPARAPGNRRYPSISLLVPLTGASPWRARLSQLRREAESRLRAEFGDRTDAELLARLDDVVAAATPPPGARSLGVFVNDVTAATVGIDIDVRERTVIDDTFATRDLVAGDLRAPRYWVLALNLDDPRLLHGHGNRLHAVALRLPTWLEQTSGRGHRLGRDRSDVLDARRGRRFRALDEALHEALADNDDPLIVAAAEPTLSRFLDSTRHIARVDGVVRRAPDRDGATIAATVAPALADVLMQRTELALQILDRAVGQGAAISGLEPVWRAAHRDKGLLIVEQTYEQAVRILPGGAITRAGDPTAPGIIDDGVDDVIEAVLARGGRVDLVAAGTLAAHESIAFVPSPRRRR